MAEESLQNMEAEFYKIYNEKIKPQLYDLENKRLVVLKTYQQKIIFYLFMPGIVTFFVVSLIFLCSMHFKPDYILSIISIAFICAIIAMIVGLLSMLLKDGSDKEFRNSLKTEISQRLLNIFGDIQWIEINKSNDVQGRAKSIISDDEIKRSSLFIEYDERTIDDEFKGIYKNVPFKISETQMAYSAHSIGEKRKYVFNGIILSFKVNKTVKNRTIVATKGDLTSRNRNYSSPILAMGILYVIFTKMFGNELNIPSIFLFIGIFVIGLIISIKMHPKEEPLNNVSLEDPKFSKRFNVYSSDQIEARYLVTTAFMERFYNLKTAFGAYNIKCSFFDDTLMIAIYTTKNLFELGSLFKSLNNPDTVNDFYQELNSIYKIINYLKLYEDTGL